jgi:hypothetical protein
MGLLLIQAKYLFRERIQAVPDSIGLCVAEHVLIRKRSKRSKGCEPLGNGQRRRALNVTRPDDGRVTSRGPANYILFL